MVYVGVDLHKGYAQVAVIEESGELKEFTVPTEAERVEEVFGTLSRPAYVAVEVLDSWYRLVDLLQRLGNEVRFAKILVLVYDLQSLGNRRMT